MSHYREMVHIKSAEERAREEQQAELEAIQAAAALHRQQALERMKRRACAAHAEQQLACCLAIAMGFLYQAS